MADSTARTEEASKAMLAIVKGDESHVAMAAVTCALIREAHRRGATLPHVIAVVSEMWGLGGVIHGLTTAQGGDA